MATDLFQIKFSGLDQLIKELNSTPAEIRKAVPRALNRTAMEVRTDIVREIGKHVNLKAGSIREVIRIDKATQGRQVAHVVMADSSRPLFDLKGVRVGKRGVSAEIYKGKGRVNYSHAFPARMNVVQAIGPSQGHVGIFERRKIVGPGGQMLIGDRRFSRSRRKYDRKRLRTATPKGYARRLPVKEIRVPGVAQQFDKAPQVATTIINNAGGILEKNFRHELSYLATHKRAVV